MQARGKTQQAAREVRALLDLMHENEAIVHKNSAFFVRILEKVKHHFTILDPEVGEEKLIQAVAAAEVKLRC